MSPSAPTFEQLTVFAAVVEYGSFSAAARRLNRTQSVVSYTIGRLEAQLGLTLFDRERRRPTLTAAGQAVLGDSRRVGVVLDQLLARAKSLAQGLEGEVSLAVDAMVPSNLVARVSTSFAAQFPTLSLVIRVAVLETLIQLVQERVCTIAIAGPIIELPDDIDRRHCGVVRMVTVAAAKHPLARLGKDLTTAVLREHRQLVLNETPAGIGERTFASYAAQTWRISDLATMKNLLAAGLGWAAMPEPMVAEDLKAGRLKRLATTGPAEWPYPLDLIRRTDTLPRPATQWLAERLISAISEQSPIASSPKRR